MASEPKICKYLDIPFQHISDAQLSAMHRRHTKAEAYALVEKIAGGDPRPGPAHDAAGRLSR